MEVPMPVDYIPNIVLSDFVKKILFDPYNGGTCITDRSPETFEKEMDTYLRANSSHGMLLETIEGYAPFCKLFVFKNWTNAIAGTMPINPLSRHLLYSDYVARNDKELPVLVRCIESNNIPTAKYLIVVAYDSEQMAKEGSKIVASFAAVAVLGQMQPKEEPMPPITIMRNALGIDEGGSGVRLDREAYLRSVEFWKKHAIVKRPLKA